MESLVTAVGILFLVSFIPPVIYVIWIRRSERYEREPWKQVAKVFIWGAIVAVIISLILSSLIIYILGETIQREYYWLRPESPMWIGLLFSVIAPMVEEFSKGMGVYIARDTITEPEDGMVYGGASGLGFAATENLLYGLAAYLLIEDFRASIILILVRSISSALLHASASGVMGYGVGRSLLFAKVSVLPYYLLAVFMHGVFNYLAAFEIIYQDPTAVLYGFFLAVIFAISAFLLLRHGIRAKDYR
ncbi:MAG: PrsW family intramembrane metalloprotease [Thermoplasmata archaeon]